MWKQFFGKTFWWTLLGTATLFCLAIPAYAFPFFATILLIFFGCGVFCVSLWKLELGLFIAWAELIAFSHGHLVEAHGISLRMVIFAAVLFAWGVLLIRQKVKPAFSHPIFFPCVGLFVLVCVSFAQAFLLRGNFTTALSDGNAYFYLLYLLPILSVSWDSPHKRQWLQVFAAASVWVSLLTLSIVFVFSHTPEWMLGQTYAFLRDTRLAEITKMTTAIFRTFLPSQIYALFFLLFLSPFFWLRSLSWKDGLIFSSIQGMAIATLLISLSRSYLVGLFVSIIIFFLALLLSRSVSRTNILPALGWHALSKALGFLFLAIALFLPVSYLHGQAGDWAAMFSSRASSVGDAAISSRWKLLDPMWQTIKEHPVLGSGFGKTVSFETDDPRAEAITGDRLWTTYAMEWGWLELWLKMGMLGPLVFLWIALTIVRGLVPLLAQPARWLAIGGLASLAMLYATHTFSPYLNHPLGIGFLLFLVPFLHTAPQGVAAVTEARQETKIQTQAAPVMGSSLRAE
jgi:hypothetical protein